MEPEAKAPLAKRIGPWIGAAAILGFIFFEVDIGQFFDALGRANMALYVPLFLVFILIWFFVESQNLSALARYFSHRISYAEALEMRGLTYLLMIINYNLGVGGLAVHLSRKRAVPLLRASSLILFYMFAEIAALAAMAAAGSLLSPGRSPVLEKTGLFCALILSGQAAFALVFRALPQAGWLGRIRANGLFSAFGEAGAGTYLKLILLRGFYFATFIPFFHFGAGAFGMAIPTLTLACVVPVIFFIGNIPVTPFGLGTIQAAMLYFFKDYGSAPAILAFSITYSTALLVLRLPIGLFYLRRAGRSGALIKPQQM